MRRKVSEYAVGLNEKQKLRFIYGLLERQFRRVFELAKRERGVTGERFLQLLETRLDSKIAVRLEPAVAPSPGRSAAQPPCTIAAASNDTHDDDMPHRVGKSLGDER